MEQSIYFLVLQWMVKLPSNSKFLHAPRFQLGSLAYEFLDFSTAAWCPARPAALRVAMQLFLLDSRADIAEQARLSAQVERRVRRAVALTGLRVHLNDDAVQAVRSLAREYRVERAVALHAGRGPHRAASERLRRIVDETVVEDVDSASSDGSDDV